MIGRESDPQWADDCDLTPARRAEHGADMERYGECGRCGQALPEYAMTGNEVDPDRCHFDAVPTDQPFQWIWLPEAGRYLRERVCENCLPRLTAREDHP